MSLRAKGPLLGGGGMALLAVGVLIWALALKAPKGEREKGKAMGEDFYAEMRRRMVEEQILARGIKDRRVIEAMLKVPRHEFVPLEYRHMAYNDHPLPIGMGQTISQPYMVALMTEAMELKPDDRVFEVGTGSGYQAAILAEICREVYTVEIVSELAERAERTLSRLGYRNVFVKCGDGFLGWPEKAPFDAIIVTCAAPYVPPPLVQQLAEGGRLVIPVGGEPYQILMRLRKVKGRVKFERLIECVFVPMTGEGVRRWQVPQEVREEFGKALNSLDELVEKLWPERLKKVEFWCGLPLDSPGDLALLGPSLSVKGLEYVSGLGIKKAVVPASVEALVEGSEAYRALRERAKATGVQLVVLAQGLRAENLDRFCALCRDLMGEVTIIAPAFEAGHRLAEVWPYRVLLYFRPGRPIPVAMLPPRAVFLSSERDLKPLLKAGGRTVIEAVICGPYEDEWLRKVKPPGPWRSVLDGKLARASLLLALRLGAKEVVFLPGRALVEYPDEPFDLREALGEGRKSALYGALKTLVEEFKPRGGKGER